MSNAKRELTLLFIHLPLTMAAMMLIVWKSDVIFIWAVKWIQHLSKVVK